MPHSNKKDKSSTKSMGKKELTLEEAIERIAKLESDKKILMKNNQEFAEAHTYPTGSLTDIQNLINLQNEKKKNANLKEENHKLKKSRKKWKGDCELIEARSEELLNDKKRLENQAIQRQEEIQQLRRENQNLRMQLSQRQTNEDTPTARWQNGFVQTAQSHASPSLRRTERVNYQRRG